MLLGHSRSLMCMKLLLFTSVYTVSEILSQLMINGKTVKVPNELVNIISLEIHK